MSAGIVGGHVVAAGRRARRERDVGAAAGSVDDEEVGAAHARALAQSEPAVACWPRDLHEDVTGSGRHGCVRDVQAVAHIGADARGCDACIGRRGCVGVSMGIEYGNVGTCGKNGRE